MPDGSFFGSQATAQASVSSMMVLSAKLSEINLGLLRYAAEIDRCRNEGRSEDDWALRDLMERKETLEADRGELVAEIQCLPAKTPFEAALKLHCCIMELDGSDDQIGGFKIVLNELFAMSANG
jgi:hypothetical protein